MLKSLKEQAKEFGLHPQDKQKPSELRNKAVGSSYWPLRKLFLVTEWRPEDTENIPILWRLLWFQ